MTEKSLKKGFHLYASRRFFYLQSCRFRPVLVWLAVLVLLTAQVQISLQEDCPRALGMEDRRIPDSSIKASTEFSFIYQAENGRLNYKGARRRKGGWLAKATDNNPWFEVNLGSTATVSRVATQGHHNYPAWVKEFKLEYSKDGNQFVFYNNQEIFQGNANQNSIKNNELKPAIDARVIRIHVIDWYSNYAAMRLEFYGCRPVSQGNVTAQAISAETIEVKWKFVGNKRDNSLPCGFTVWYQAVQTSTTNNHTWNYKKVDMETTNYIIHNLLAYTTYEIYVQALNDACSADLLSNANRVTTHEKAPSSPPQNITMVTVTYNSVVLQWLPPPLRSRNGKLLQYLVRSWPADEFINNSITRNYSHDNTTSKQKGRFGELKSDTNYAVILTASNSMGASPSSPPLFFRTLKAPSTTSLPITIPSTTSSPATEELLPTIEASPSTNLRQRNKEEIRGTSQYVITGVALAVAVGLVLLIAIAVYLFRKRRKNKGFKPPKKNQGVIFYDNDLTFSNPPNLVDSIENRRNNQEDNEFQTDHSYYKIEGNEKQNNFIKSNGFYASDVYSYANSEDLRCNQSKNEQFVEQNPTYDTADNVWSTNETPDYDTVQGNPVYSPVSDKRFFDKQENVPSIKNLDGKEVMSKLSSTQKTPKDSRVNTAQPLMEPEYAVLEGPDPTSTRQSDNVYEDLENSDTGSGYHKYPQKHEPRDYDVIWNPPNHSQSDIKSTEESPTQLSSKTASNSPSLYYEKVCLSKVDEEVVYDTTYETVRD